MHRPGILSLHAVTSTNALHFAFQNSSQDETRRLLLLQNASFLTMFRGDSGRLKTVHLDELEPAIEKGAAPTIDEIFAEINRDRFKAASKTLAWLKGNNDPQEFITAARFRSPPCRSGGRHTGNRPACRAIRGRRFRRRSGVHARRDQALPDADSLCTRRSAACRQPRRRRVSSEARALISRNRLCPSMAASLSQDHSDRRSESVQQARAAEILVGCSPGEVPR